MEMIIEKVNRSRNIFLSDVDIAEKTVRYKRFEPKNCYLKSVALVEKLNGDQWRVMASH